MPKAGFGNCGIEYGMEVIIRNAFKIRFPSLVGRATADLGEEHRLTVRENTTQRADLDVASLPEKVAGRMNALATKAGCRWRCF